MNQNESNGQSESGEVATLALLMVVAFEVMGTGNPFAWAFAVLGLLLCVSHLGGHVVRWRSRA